MRFNIDFNTLFSTYKDSVMKFTDEVKEMCEETDRTDPDPEATKAYRMDKMLRKWFMSGGGMGY